MSSDVAPHVAAASVRASKWCSAILIALGASVLAGWVFDVAVLRTPP